MKANKFSLGRREKKKEAGAFSMLQEVVDCNKDMTTGYSAVTKGTSESVSHFD